MAPGHAITTHHSRSPEPWEVWIEELLDRVRALPAPPLDFSSFSDEELNDIVTRGEAGQITDEEFRDIIMTARSRKAERQV